MAHTSLTILQRIDIPIGIIQAVLGTLFAAIAAPFRGPNAPKTLKRHLLLTVTRKVLARLSPEQLQSITGTTESNYLAWAKSQHVTPRSISLPSLDTRAFWIGDPGAQNIVIFYHGGGWAMPGADGHLAFVSSLVSKASRSRKSVAVLVLQYDLAPGQQYPRQLVQAVELLRYATTQLRKSPEQIMLLGDSAGANMILGVLSHFTTFNSKSDRFRTHEAQDPASTASIKVWLDNFLGPSKPDAYTEPLNNDARWWSGLPGIVDDMLITVASNEMMADDTRALASKITTVYRGLTLFASENDFHAEPTIGPSLGMEEGEAARLMIEWVLDRS